jgi:outer membrane protein
MRRIVAISFLAFCVSLFYVSSLYAAAVLKIGVFDLQKIMRDSKVIQEYRRTLGKEMEPKRKLLAEKQDSIKLIEEKLKRDDKSTPPDERKRLLERHAKESKELQRIKEDFETELQKIDRELSQRALREIIEITRNFAQKEKYTLIFEKAQAGIVYSEDSFDITQKIIELYDAKR